MMLIASREKDAGVYDNAEMLSGVITSHSTTSFRLQPALSDRYDSRIIDSVDTLVLVMALKSNIMSMTLCIPRA